MGVSLAGGVLLDANVLVRLSRSDDPQFQIAADSITSLRRAGHGLHTIPQGIREYWVVATRPREQNGLGMLQAEAAAFRSRFETLFPIKPDSPEQHARWVALVDSLQIRGKSAHDAAYVAAMQVHDMQNLLTFDAADFARFQALINVFRPEQIAANSA